MSQTFFVWPHGGQFVSISSTFNHWNPQPLVKQGNYFFGVFDLPDGVYQYKYVVDGRWVYDISQPHEDDGSGNWNNYVEVGKAVLHKEAPGAAHSAPAKAQPPPREQQQKGKEQQQKGKPQQQSKKEQQQQPQESKKERKQKNKQQTQEPEPEPVVEEPVATEAAPPPAAVPEKKEKTLVSIITLEVVACDIDTDMEKLETFVRSIQRPGLKWEGGAIKEHVFGLKKLEIILQAQDDVAVEDDILVAIQGNEDLVGGASILNFSC
jgi:translation elongation factor EF-1beta